MIRIALNFLLLLFYSAASYSSEINILSDILEVDKKNKDTVFIGNVYAIHNDLEIWSDKVTIFFRDESDEIKEIVAKTKVKIKKGDMVALGNAANYKPSKNILTINGNVKVQEKDNIINCDELVLDLNKSTSIMSSYSSSRVNAIIINN